MRPASAIRLQIENKLAQRIPAALSPAQRIIRPVAATGITSVDDLLGGGLPIGAITEMTGPESSGRTSLTLSYIARVTQRGGVCAWIDVSDSLHVESAAAAGVDLSRLLWVRCGVGEEPKSATPYQFTLPDKYFVPPPVECGLHGGGFGTHPRNETRGLSDAVNDWLSSEMTGSRYAEAQARKRLERKLFEPRVRLTAQKKNSRGRTAKPWARIEQSLSATDLLLQGGGFSAIVLDLTGIAPEFVSRIELSIWFRYRAAADRTQAGLLLLTQYPCAKSAGELLLRFHSADPLCNEKTVFKGIGHHMEVERQRFASMSSNVISLKKSSQRESGVRWSSRSIWAGPR